MPTLTDLDVEWVSLVDRAAVRDPVNQSEPARFLVWKRQTPDEGVPMTPEEKAALDKAQADLTKAQGDLTTALAAIETQKAEIADLKKAAEPEPKADAPVDLSKADPATRAYIEKMEADRAADRVRAEKAEKDAKEANDIAKAERDERLKATFITKAEGYKALVVKADEFGPVLKEASEKLSKASYDEIERVLKAADEGLAASDLFKESGRSREGNAPESAYAEAVTKAEKLRETDPKLSKAQAVDKVLSEDRALQDRYLAEQRG